jgi:hypothetical protein
MSTVTASGGLFTITDAQGNTQKVDLGTLMMMIQMDTVENLDAQIAIKLEEMQSRNDQIKMYTDMLSWCNNMKATGKDDNPVVDGKAVEATITLGGKTQTYKAWAEELGISWTDIPHDKDTAEDKDNLDSWNAAWDANISAIQAEIDMMNTDSQMDNIELQNLLDKRSNAFQTATQVMSTNQESVEATLRNL